MDDQPLITPPFTFHPSPFTTIAWRLRATFAGNVPPRSYTTPDVRHANPGWDSEVFNRRIASLEFFLPTGHKIIMSGMEAYNFFIEATQALSQHGGARLEALWLCGKLPAANSSSLARSPLSPFTFHPSPIEMWRIGQGQVIRQRRPWGLEWGGTPTRGWKRGLVGSAPVSTIITHDPLPMTHHPALSL